METVHEEVEVRLLVNKDMPMGSVPYSFLEKKIDSLEEMMQKLSVVISDLKAATLEQDIKGRKIEGVAAIRDFLGVDKATFYQMKREKQLEGVLYQMCERGRMYAYENELARRKDSLARLK